jgi:hypothetical protein
MKGTICFIYEHMQHSALNGSKYCLNLYCSFFQDHDPQILSTFNILLSSLGVVFLMCIFVNCICLVCIVTLCVFVILCVCVFVILAVLL